MEYCYRSSWIRDRLNNDSSRNWILTKLSDHIRIPFSYFNALLGGLWARIKRLIHFGVHVDGCVIWTWKYQLIEILWMALKHFPRYFGQGRKRRIIIRSTKISYMYLRVYIYIYEKKNRDKKKNKEELAYVTRLWSKWKGNNDFNWKFYEKRGRLHM